jgi:hypothetical protein
VDSETRKDHFLSGFDIKYTPTKATAEDEDDGYYGKKKARVSDSVT